MDHFDYFTIIFVVLFYAVFLLRFIQLLTKGINPLALGIGKSVSRALLELAFGVGLLVWTFEILRNAFHLSVYILPDIITESLFSSTPIRSLGVLLTCAGFVIFLLALRAFGNSWRVGIDTNKPGTLITGGIFSLTRNPVFLFVNLYFIGTWLIYSSPFFLIAALVTVIGIHIQIREEEKFLLAHYGSEYETYMRSARRYF
jgi:protein-S-isoprenylcysteine O-methyltransferase Ste14